MSVGYQPVRTISGLVASGKRTAGNLVVPFARSAAPLIQVPEPQAERDDVDQPDCGSGAEQAVRRTQRRVGEDQVDQLDGASRVHHRDEGDEQTGNDPQPGVRLVDTPWVSDHQHRQQPHHHGRVDPHLADPSNLGRQRRMQDLSGEHSHRHGPPWLAEVAGCRFTRSTCTGTDLCISHAGILSQKEREGSAQLGPPPASWSRPKENLGRKARSHLHRWEARHEDREPKSACRILVSLGRRMD